MSYSYLLIICLLMMITIALVMYYLGTKISYNYILYNASVSVGSGVIFFAVKMIVTMDTIGSIEQTLDMSIMVLLAIIWVIALIETFTVEIMENGREIKQYMKTVPVMIKTIEMKEIPFIAAKSFHSLSVKAKTILVKNKHTIKIQKWISEYNKN
ncbi:hypothetical protein [Ureibacillus sinduriensis]|uniref:Uncharacterized protein n=1 Tax=Ureibacillus sinduriensis BLB-1 = JCM 15800 TaxID=1384057 RepID=A0A0A3HYB6_9BACL|nr:hypothetical protein [Ureibacillus sinduriensis]KGR77444.1 hypothetical protein CD33_02815 [Ureibacillus sinduriensis BLB-1 = JCM 15800]